MSSDCAYNIDDTLKYVLTVMEPIINIVPKIQPWIQVHSLNCEKVNSEESLLSLINRKLDVLMVI